MLEPYKRGDYLRVVGYILAFAGLIFFTRGCATPVEANEIRLGPAAGSQYVKLSDGSVRDGGELAVSVQFLVEFEEGDSATLLVPVSYSGGHFGGGGAALRYGLGTPVPRNGGSTWPLYVILGGKATFLAQDSEVTDDMTITAGPMFGLEIPLPFGDNFYSGISVSYEWRVSGDERIEVLIPIMLTLPADL